MKHLKRFNEELEDYISDGERPLENSNDYLSEQNIEDQFNKWCDSIDYTEADYVSFKAGYKSAFNNIEYFESNNDLDKQDKEKAERNQISNFPHSSKEDTEKREKREKRSYKEDPDGMYPRDDKRYDDSSDSKGGWQDGMGKPSWLGESVAEDFLEELYDKGAISSDVYDITREEEDLSSLKGTDKQIKTKVLRMLDGSGGISSDVYQMELEELDY